MYIHLFLSINLCILIEYSLLSSEEADRHKRQIFRSIISSKGSYRRMKQTVQSTSVHLGALLLDRRGAPLLPHDVAMTVIVQGTVYVEGPTPLSLLSTQTVSVFAFWKNTILLRRLDGQQNNHQIMICSAINTHFVIIYFSFEI